MTNEPPSAIARACILERLYLGVSTAKLLDFFLGVKDFDYPEIDIARKTGISSRQVSRSLPLLIDFGLVLQTRISGKSRMYKLNTESIAVKNLQKFVYQLVEQNLDKIVSEEEKLQEQLAEPPRVNP